MSNATWLCQTCARLIDVDAVAFPAELLHGWKREAERVARREVLGFVEQLNEGGGWRWDQGTRTYREVGTGRSLGPRDIIRLREQLIEASLQHVGRLATRLARERLSSERWFTSMVREVKNLYIACYALAHGGWASLTPDARAALSLEIRDQLILLDQIARDVRRGEYGVGDVATRRKDLRLRAAEVVGNVRTAVDWP